MWSLRGKYVELNRVTEQNILNSDKKHFRRNAKFLNKAMIKPIRARDVQVRQQIDLMDMGKNGVVRINGKSYRYVLSVMDVFSRFVWPRALATKCSKVITKELETIYMEHGPPHVIQSDQEGEFKGAVKKLCHHMKIKTIYSRPYHPQSQGKVERSHRSLRAKMEYDLIKIGLPTYQRILSNDPKEVLSYKTPFEVYFARKCTSRKTSETDDELVASVGRINPTAADQRRRSRRVSQVRQEARKATIRCERRTQRAKLRSNPPARYTVGEKVFVRMAGKGHKKRHVIEARIEKRNLKLQTYKVAYSSPVTGRKTKRSGYPWMTSQASPSRRKNVNKRLQS